MTAINRTIRTCTLSLILLTVLISGCRSYTKQDGPPLNTGGRLSLFLVVPDEIISDISFTLKNIHIISENGPVLPVAFDNHTVHARSVSESQLRLGTSPLPSGKYSELIFTIHSAYIKRDDTVSPLSISDESISVPVNVTINRQQNTSVFISWNAARSVSDDNSFNPVMSERMRKQEVRSALIYVTNEFSDNVSVINRYTGKVVETIMVGRKPRGIAATFSGARQRVIVANSGSDSVSVIDPVSDRVEHEVPIRFGTEPVAVAVADIANGKKLLFVANYRSNNVSIVDLATYGELQAIEVGSGPVSLAADPPADMLTVNRYLNSSDINELRSYREKFINVYVVNQNSNNVSVLRIDIMTGRCTDVMHLDVDWDPRSLYVDYIRGKVYVANYGSDNLSVINILKTLSPDKAGAVASINNVGNRITAVTSDPGFDRIYLLRDVPGEIVMLRSSPDENDELHSMMPPVMGRIGVGDNPRALMMDPEKSNIYVVNRGSDNVYIIDKTTRRTDQIIRVGNKPYDIAVLSE